MNCLLKILWTVLKVLSVGLIAMSLAWWTRSRSAELLFSLNILSLLQRAVGSISLIEDVFKRHQLGLIHKDDILHSHDRVRQAKLGTGAVLLEHAPEINQGLVLL